MQLKVGDLVFDPETGKDCKIEEITIVNHRTLIRIGIPTIRSEYRYPDEVRVIEG